MRPDRSGATEPGSDAYFGPGFRPGSESGAGFGSTAAFAEGRRLREAAGRRQARYQRKYESRLAKQSARQRARVARMHARYAAGQTRGIGRPRRSRAPLVLLLLVLLVGVVGAGAATAAAASAAAVFGAIVILGIFATPVLVVGGFLFSAVRTRRRMRLRRGGAAGTAPIPARPPVPPRPDAAWQYARRDFHAVCAEFGAYECDPIAVLRLPALADVRVASTARFVDAFAEAQALDTDAFPGPEHAASFVAAAQRAVKAWRAAKEAAERIRLSGLSLEERSAVERTVKLLTTARDSDSPAERLAAYAKARAELAKLDKAGVLHLPRPATAALAYEGRGELPA